MPMRMSLATVMLSAIGATASAAPHHCGGGGGPLPADWDAEFEAEADERSAQVEPGFRDCVVGCRDLPPGPERARCLTDCVGDAELITEHAPWLLEDPESASALLLFGERFNLADELTDDAAITISLIHEMTEHSNIARVALAVASERLEHASMSPEAEAVLRDVVFDSLTDSRDWRIRRVAATVIGQNIDAYAEHGPFLMELIHTAESDRNEQVREAADRIVRQYYGL